MLSRTAENLYWMSRFVERAENIARMLDVSYRMAMVPQGVESPDLLWKPILGISSEPGAYYVKNQDVTAERVMEWMALDPDNPSSIYTSVANARENARAQRSAISSEMWESLNATWLELQDMKFRDIKRSGVREFFEWVKERSHLFRGVSVGTMYRDEAFHFIRLGTFLERADNTARILDVKYHVLLPETERVGGYVDYFQWGALLRSVSAFRAYRLAYHDAIYPWRVAELLILNEDMPRSLHHCFENVTPTLDELARGKRLECLRVAGAIHADLRFGNIRDIFGRGLHEFLLDFIARNNRLGEQVQKDFMMSFAAA
jgi:uncharacterized alpha-E superfamily protein